MSMMNNENPNFIQRHADLFFNGQIPAQNFHALGSQVTYVDSGEHSMFSNAGDFGNMAPRHGNNPMGNHVSGGNIGNQLNMMTAGLTASGHLPYHQSVHNGGIGDINIQGTNIPMEAIIAQGLLQRPDAGMYLQNQNFSMQNGDVTALTGFRGSAMDYPVQMHPNENLHDYALHQLQSPHLSVGPNNNYPQQIPNPSYMHHQQQLSSAISSGGISIRQANNDSRLRSHVTDLVSSMAASYHSNSMVQVRNVELGVAGTKPLNTATTYGGQYDESLGQYERHKQTQLQVHHHLQSADTTNTEDCKPKLTVQRPVDSYGLLGLVHVIKSRPNNTVSAHALGVDLTTLGLNLTQPDDLYKDFLSPFSEKSVKDVLDRQFTVPQSYNSKPAADLQPHFFPHFRMGTLFYIFYSMPKDVAQLYAAHELMNREWLYHKEHRLWLIRDKRKDLLVKTDTYERGAFIYFDHNQWKVIQQENFVLKYELIEERPVLPNQPQTNFNKS